MDDTECYHWTRAAQRARQVGAIASDADLRENFDTLNEVQNVKHVWLIEPPKDLDALMQVYRRTGARFLVSMLWGAYPGTEGLRMTAEETAAARRAGLRGVRPGSRPTYPRHCRTNFVEVLAQRLGDPVNAPIPQVSSAARLSPAGLTCAAGGINSLLVKTTYSITHAQAKLPAIVRTVQSGRVVAVSKRNETVAFVISRERMESLLETMELLSNPDFMRAWRAEKAGRGGKLYPASSLAD
jgi:prevent-host-death family protein